MLLKDTKEKPVLSHPLTPYAAASQVHLRILVSALSPAGLRAATGVLQTPLDPVPIRTSRVLFHSSSLRELTS